jgi:ppGpp synthetase/RelA/SpoT-type nucleotidyltranferase
MDAGDNQGQDSDSRMTESEFQDKWEDEKAIYDAWGQFVVQAISDKLEIEGKDLSSFLKVPAKHRLKDERSLIDKAYYRAGKSYSDPYNDIEDKVGARFIVLLINDIKLICDIITNNVDLWTFDACKHFDEDKEKDPLLFTYQSVHFILRPKKYMEVNGVGIPIDIPCEVQIRTLLQHAHAELTHDAIYKAKRAIQPKVHRTVAKSMALIETTDDFFTAVTQQLKGPIDELGIISKLDALYYSLTGIKSDTQKSLITILDEFEEFVDNSLITTIETFVQRNPAIPEIIRSKYSEGAFYKQSTVLLIYWMLKRKKRNLLDNWPLDRQILIPLANDLGVSTLDE